MGRKKKDTSVPEMWESPAQITELPPTPAVDPKHRTTQLSPQLPSWAQSQLLALEMGAKEIVIVSSH